MENKHIVKIAIMSVILGILMTVAIVASREHPHITVIATGLYVIGLIYTLTRPNRH